MRIYPSTVRGRLILGFGTLIGITLAPQILDAGYDFRSGSKNLREWLILRSPICDWNLQPHPRTSMLQEINFEEI